MVSDYSFFKISQSALRQSQIQQRTWLSNNRTEADLRASWWVSVSCYCEEFWFHLASIRQMAIGVVQGNLQRFWMFRLLMGSELHPFPNIKTSLYNDCVTHVPGLVCSHRWVKGNREGKQWEKREKVCRTLKASTSWCFNIGYNLNFKAAWIASSLGAHIQSCLLRPGSGVVSAGLMKGCCDAHICPP